ncbi:cadherin repeat domain-containing protein [Bathymodiolus thermophilus thioautotrophic gill symbiont]|uniref:Cadherin domain-containing protein n=1 Tax=Bathymodiolus thermophilus thioautotrophic gill symbiont TaxID=2360 RepID=A0A1J5UMC8_9GAMM|nr:cadherin repeat domain-containing protein [Bathymodiolus thermophilus thioautotrophic gill symbiont]OIR25383.1 hypothetical protein BGC33_06330 [Bathymodiolus thermophilus thioautotrophic gill symbiont]
MNMFNRFIIASFCLLTLSAQTLALDFTQATKDTTYILSDTQKTIRVTLDDYAFFVSKNNRFFDENNNQIDSRTFVNESGVGTSANLPYKIDFLEGTVNMYKTWDLTLSSYTIAIIKDQDGKKFTLQTPYKSGNIPPSLFSGTSINNTESPSMLQRTLKFCWEDCGTLTITSTNNLATNEGNNLEHTLTASDTAATFSITENTSGLFSLSGTNNTLTFNGTTTNYESATKSYTVKVKATTGDGSDKNTTQTITVTLNDLNDETPTAITLTGNRTIAENTNTGTELGTLSTTDADANDTFTYTSSNTKFTIDNDKLKLNTTLDYENATSLNTTITVTDGNNHTFDKIFNFTVGDIDDTAPTNILLSNVNLIKDQPANTLVGTLSASDVDTNTPLTFAVNDTTNFKIVNGNELRTNKSITTALGNTININITASDNTNDSAPQPFTITITTIYIAAPVIDKFTVTQGENKGPLISKDGGEVTVSASAGTGSYTWSSNDFSNTSTSKAFVFNPQSANIGTRTITLKVTAGDFSSERVLKLKLVDTYPNGRTDTNGNGISDSKESGNSDNELPAGTNKKITSPENTRILPGIIGEDSGQLTLDQLKQYRVANHLSDYTKDTLATGDIYDYIIEGLSATGNSTQVIIELATPIPANAVLRQYSLATGWRNFVVGNNNIQSKANTSNTCDNTDGTWQTGLITGATCLKLTLKDGGENDADGNQANGVIESTVSIATPVVGGNDDSSSNSSSGGGCVYNPSAPARFDTVFILLMTLSAYYLIRRRRRFSH